MIHHGRAEAGPYSGCLVGEWGPLTFDSALHVAYILQYSAQYKYGTLLLPYIYTRHKYLFSAIQAY